MQDVLQTPARRPIEILYEDGCYVIFNKPAGLLVIPSPKKEKNTLVSLVNSRYAPSGDSFRLHPCHRLDRETSGVIVFAKGKKNQQLMMDLFKRRTVKKKYIAFAQGRLKMGRGELRSPVRDFDQKRFTKNPHAQWAVTRFNVIEARKYFSIIEAYPITGRTNQIRIQFSEAGFPLVGERKYAFAKDFRLKFRRIALHASEIEWVHPVSHKLIRVTSPLPADMAEFMARN